MDNAVHLYANKYLSEIPEILDSWYYSGEWEKYDVRREDSRHLEFYPIFFKDEGK